MSDSVKTSSSSSSSGGHHHHHHHHHHEKKKKSKKCNHSRAKPTSKMISVKKKASRVAPSTLMVFWDIMKKDKRQSLMKIGEDVIWDRLHLLLLRQGLCLGCQEAVYRDVEVLKEDLQERVGPCFIEVKKQSVCLREDMLCNMDILCLLQRASEVQSEEEEEPREGCPSVDSPALSYEYLVDVVAVVFKEHLESAYGLAQQKSRAFESLLLEEEILENERRNKKKKKKKKKKKNKNRSNSTTGSPPLPSSSTTSTTNKKGKSYPTSPLSFTGDGGDDAEDRKSSNENSTPPPTPPTTTTTTRSTKKKIESSGTEDIGEEIDREVEQFRKMLEQSTVSPETRVRPKIKIEFPKNAFSKVKTTK